jgi:hypothetical protein
MLKANTLLFPSGYPPAAGDNLVVDILAQEPPIDQSVNDSVMPMIYVAYSKNPLSRVEYTGRDTIDVAGARTYYLEFYIVIITREITKEKSMESCEQISNIVRDTFQKNLRMKNPILPTDFIAVTNEILPVPFILRSSNPTIQAINVICRPQQKVTFTEP